MTKARAPRLADAPGLAGTRALVTGGAGGIGAAVAQALAEHGARVLVTDRDSEAAQRVADAIAERPGVVAPLACRLDVTDEGDWAEALDLARQRLGGLSLLVNNAGVPVGGTIEQTSLAEWRRAFAVHADGAFLGCKLALPLLREAQPAAIVNIASAAAITPRADMAAYGASKAAVTMLTKSVALHCAEQGWAIRCNAVLPGYVDTPMIDAMAPSPGFPRERLAAALARQMPLGRLIAPAEVAAAVLWLAGPDSVAMTGAELRLDGGLTAG